MIKKFLISAVIAAASFVGTGQAVAVEKPQLNVIIPFGPGGGTDIIFRRFEKFAAEKHNTTLVATYKPGANGLLGYEALKTSKTSVGLFTFDTIGYYVSSAQNATVNSENVLSVQKNVFGFVSGKNVPLDMLMKQKSGVKIGYLLMSQKELALQLARLYGTSDVILVPYKTGAEMLQNVASGDIDLAITSMPALVPLITAGRIYLLATDTMKPLEDYPDAVALGTKDTAIPLYNKGSAVILPPDATDEVRATWKKLVADFQKDPDVLLDMKKDFSTVVTRTSKEVVRDIEQSKEMVQRSAVK